MMSKPKYLEDKMPYYCKKCDTVTTHLVKWKLLDGADYRGYKVFSANCTICGSDLDIFEHIVWKSKKGSWLWEDNCKIQEE